MNYFITPAATSREQLLRFRPEIASEDLARASALARSLGARYTPAFDGFCMVPSVVRRWALLFEAGFTVEKRQVADRYVWTYGRTAQERLPIYEAVRAAKQPRIVEAA